MNINPAFTGPYTEPVLVSSIRSQRKRILRGGQTIGDIDAADNSCSNVTTLEAKSFQDDIPSLHIDNFTVHYVLVFDLTSRQDATESCQ